VIELTSS